MEVEDGAISADEAWQICETWFRSRRVVWGNDDVANRDGVRVSRDPGFEATQGGVTIGDAIVDAIDEAIVVTGRDSCERFDVHFLRSISTRHCEKAFFSERPRSRPRSSQRPRATCDMRSLQWTRDLFSGGRKRKRVDARARPTIFSLPQDLIATHILGAANMPDLADLARLRAVSHEMCDAMAQSGRHVREIDVYEAVKLGCLSTLQRLRPQGCLGFSVDNGRRLVRLAVKHGQLEILKWLAANGWSLDKCLCAKAAKGGHLEAIQWLCANGCPWDAKTCASAAEGRHLELLQWARVNGCPWDKYTCLYAAVDGHLEVLQWARANGCPWDSETCAWAAMGRQLEVLQWARANGCPWDSETFREAAENGDFEQLEWLRANGCPWDQWMCESAAIHGNHEVLQWLREHGCLWDEWECIEALKNCAEHESTDEDEYVSSEDESSDDE
jgi:hypothetical protein